MQEFITGMPTDVNTLEENTIITNMGDHYFIQLGAVDFRQNKIVTQEVLDLMNNPSLRLIFDVNLKRV